MTSAQCTDWGMGGDPEFSDVSADARQTLAFKRACLSTLYWYGRIPYCPNHGCMGLHRSNGQRKFSFNTEF